MNIDARSILLPVAIVAFACGWVIKPDGNASLSYGDTGQPKNCRAIIKDNVDQYKAKKYSSDDIIASIERNCGANGHSWGR